MYLLTVDQVTASSPAKIDLTVTISVIIAICAIISPVLVAIVNNRHQLKMRKLELEHEKNIKMMEESYNRIMRLFEEYLGALEGCIKNKTEKTEEAYGIAFGNALMYASFTAQSIMFDIDEKIRNSNRVTIKTEVDRHMIANISGTLMYDLKVFKDNYQKD